MSKNEVSIKKIYKSYLGNLEAVNSYFSKFSILAIGEDNNILDEIKTPLKNLLESWGVDLDALLKKNDGINKELVEIKVKIKQEEIDIINDLNDKKSKISPKNFEILSKGSFLMLNNYFEYLLADLLSYYYVKFQKVLDDVEFKVSLKDVNDYESIDELVNSLIQKEVESMLVEKTFDQLLTHFEKALSIPLEKSIIDWDAVKEYRERRHIIVHNSSIVNKKYITKSGNKFNLKIGDEVRIGKRYFNKSLQDFQMAGLLIIFNCWGKWDKEDADNAIEEMLTKSFDFLNINLNDSAKKLCIYSDSIEARNEGQEDCLLKLKINKCIVLKRIDDKVGLKKELKSIKVGTATPIFKVAYQILNDNDEGLLDNIRKARALEELNIETYLNWPIFEFVRKKDELNSEIIKILKHQIPSLSESNYPSQDSELNTLMEKDIQPERE